MAGELKRIKQSQAAKAKSLAEWRASRIHEMDLPSGLHVKVRDVDLTDLLMAGKLPDSVMEIANEAAQNGSTDIDLKELVKNANDFNQMMDTLVEFCLIEPAIGDVPDDTHVTLAEMPISDKLAIFNFANREADKMRPFREGEKQPVQAV